MSSTRFTVVMATCNRPDRIGRTLDAIGEAIRASGKSHAIVVADNGTDRLAEAEVQSFARRSSLPGVRYLRCPPRDRCKALNAAVRAATTEWIAFTDDDTLPVPEWLSAASAYAEASGVNIFGGRVEPGKPEGPMPLWMTPGKSGHVPGHVIFVRYAPRQSSGLLGAGDRVPFGANFFARKSLFEKYGGFDETLWPLLGRAALGGDDTEFEVRVRERGERIGYCHEALIIHPVHHERCTLSDQFRLAFEYGWRDPIVFFRKDRPLIEAYRLPLLAKFGWRAFADYAGGDQAGAVDDMLKLIRCWGEMRSRWSSAYRQRAAQMEVRP
jgi:GT2 family glycosyltransferase